MKAQTVGLSPMTSFQHTPRDSQKLPHFIRPAQHHAITPNIQKGIFFRPSMGDKEADWKTIPKRLGHMYKKTWLLKRILSDPFFQYNMFKHFACSNKANDRSCLGFSTLAKAAQMGVPTVPAERREENSETKTWTLKGSHRVVRCANRISKRNICWKPKVQTSQNSYYANLCNLVTWDDCFLAMQNKKPTTSSSGQPAKALMEKSNMFKIGGSNLRSKKSFRKRQDHGQFPCTTDFADWSRAVFLMLLAFSGMWKRCKWQSCEFVKNCSIYRYISPSKPHFETPSIAKNHLKPRKALEPLR